MQKIKEPRTPPMNIFTTVRKFLIVVISLSALGQIHAQEPVQWRVQTTMDNQIFPSLVYAMANLKTQTVAVGNHTARQVPADMAPLQTFAKKPLRVSFSRLAPGSRATIKIKENAIMESLSTSVNLSRERDFSLTLNFKYDAMLGIRQSKPLNVEISVSIDGAPARVQTTILTIRPLNDCPYFTVTSPSKGTGYDLSWMFAAYVNEDHPLVDQVLKAALATKIVNQFDGYQSKDIDQVRNQVRAVWAALCLRGVTYSNITTTANRSEITFSQHVRLLGESIKSDQANCVDGSVLIASVLEKIGIETELVKVPGHMFIRFWLDPWLDTKSRHYVCLETTMMGDGFPLPPKTPKARALEVANASYERSWNYANENFSKNESNLNSPPDAGYRIINIADSRKRGIIPIPEPRIFATPR
jgi:hypothetical protein